MQTATIYCKAYIAQWLFYNFGDPVKLNRNTNFKDIILNCLTKNYHEHSDYNKTLYPTRVDIQLNESLIAEVGHTLSLSLQHHINDVLAEHMDCELYQFVTAHNILGMSIDLAIMKYMVTLQFTDDQVNFWTIRTRYYRFKQNLTKNFVTSDTNINARP